MVVLLDVVWLFCEQRLRGHFQIDLPSVDDVLSSEYSLNLLQDNENPDKLQ